MLQTLSAAPPDASDGNPHEVLAAVPPSSRAAVMFASVLVYSVGPGLDRRSLPGKTADRSIDLRLARYAATPAWLLSKPARGE
ncbi:hypothetical protein AB0J63_32970 [Streptosporangium canum]|uniref:hypothetical protein n=1 Tax=Streptosporangium canum TaxID=324952 RepID=UPI003431D75A